jgi:glycosyltransferase involved in cell wall biosynthesis
MKIAVWHNLNSGGGKRALYDHIKGLIERGHTVISHCPDTVDQSYLSISNLTEEKIFPLNAKLNKRISWFKLFNSYDSIIEKNGAELEHCQECAKVINEGGFDILFANSSSLFSMSHISRFINIPKFIYLGEPHRVLYEARPSHFLWRAPLNQKNNYLNNIIQRSKQLYKMFWYSIIVREEYISAKAFDLILVNSFFSRESVKRSYRLDAKVCYLGIDTNKFCYKEFKKQPYVIGMGAIINNKGIEQSIESVAMVEQDIRPELVWIGNRKQGEYAESLLSFAQQKGVKLTLKTNRTDELLFEYVSNASAFLYFPHLEPFGLAPLEANALGTAVISINEGGIKETIVNGVNGFVVSHFDSVQIAKLITKFVTDIPYAEEFGRKSREHIIAKWNLTGSIDNIEKYIIELAAKNIE